MNGNPGYKTTEFWQANFVIFVNSVLAASGAVLAYLHDTGAGPPWVSLAMIAVGALGSVWRSNNYQNNRTELKAPPAK